MQYMNRRPVGAIIVAQSRISPLFPLKNDINTAGRKRPGRIRQVPISPAASSARPGPRDSNLKGRRSDPAREIV